jgi:hypothetical protein
MARPTDDFATSAARTTTGQGSTIYLHPAAEWLSLIVSVTAVSGTTPSATFSVQWSNDGTIWADAETPDAFTALTATGVKAKTFQVKGEFARLVWTISGTTPSFTFSATGVTSGTRIA